MKLKRIEKTLIHFNFTINYNKLRNKDNFLKQIKEKEDFSRIIRIVKPRL